MSSDKNVYRVFSNAFFLKSDFVLSDSSFLKPILLAFVMIALAACHPIKRITSSKPLPEEKEEVLELKMDSARFRCQWLSAKISASTEIDGKSNSFTVSLRMRSDSAIWMSISSLGIEAVRILVTKDSVKLIDRMNSKYVKEDFAYVNKTFPFSTDFEVLEALLTGNYFSYLDARKLRSSYIDSSNYLLSTLRKRSLRRAMEVREPNKRIIEDVWLDPFTFRIVKLSVDDNKLKKKLIATYDDFHPVEYGAKPDTLYFPTTSTFQVESEKPVFIRLEFSKISINKEQEFPFLIPEKYEPMK